MSEKNVDINVVCLYNGHTMSPNGNVDIKLKCSYGELVDYIRLVQMLNNDILVEIQLPDEKPDEVGTFRIKSINVDHDGEGKLSFNSMVDFVNLSTVNKLCMVEKDTPFKVKFSATIEIEEDGEAGGDWDDDDGEEDWD